MAAKKKHRTTTKKSASKKRKTKVDSDLQLVGIIALIAALAAFVWKGADGIMWYAIPAALGVALLYEAYK